MTEIGQALFSQDLATRILARGYLQVNDDESFFRPFYYASNSTPEEIIWIAVGAAAEYARCDQAGFSESAIQLKETIHAESSAIAPGFKALAAFTLAAVTTQREMDMADFERMAKVPLTEADLKDVKYDIIRILRYSPRMRQKLIDLNPPWAGFSKAEIEALGRTDNIFSLP